MTRTANPSSRYNVHIHKVNGYLYASTQVPSVNEVTGKKTYKRIIWGTITTEKMFIPGNQYYLASHEERLKLNFPSDWDISETKKLSGNRNPGRPSIEGQDENRLYGHIWLLEQIAEKTGLKADLIDVFNGNEEIVNALLTLAMFRLSGHGSYCHVQAWQKYTKTPISVELTPSFITRLLQSITDQHRMDLFRKRVLRVDKNELCAVDSTSRSAYGTSLCDIKWGKNKDQLPLPQTMEVVVYTLDGHMPIYYRSFPGNIPDSRSLQTILHDLENVGINRVVLITDRGYDTIRNLELYILKDQPMIMAAKTSQGEVAKKIASLESYSHHPKEMTLCVEKELYMAQYDIDYQIETTHSNVKTAKKLKLNLYFDAVRRCHILSKIDIEIALQERRLKEIVENNEDVGDEKSCKRNYSWFDLTTDSSGKKLTSYHIKEKKLKKARQAAGFFANYTLMLDIDPQTAHEHYKLRDEQEKYFDMMKGTCESDRQRNWSEPGKEGSRFVLFLAQILGGYISHYRKEKLDDKFPSIAHIFEEMKSIRCIEHPHKEPFITPFIGSQIKICEAMEISIPKDSSPDYLVKKTTKGKRGRPRKQKVIETIH